MRAYVSGRVCMYVAASSKKRIYNWHYIIIMLMMFNTALMQQHGQKSRVVDMSINIDIHIVTITEIPTVHSFVCSLFLSLC